MMYLSSVLCVSFLIVASYQEIFSGNKESIPFWMGLAIINAIAIQGF